MDKELGDPTVFAGSGDLTGKRVGRFQISVLLGKGGMGEVYLAEDLLLRRSVALKRVSTALRSDPQGRQLLIKEAERTSQLNDERVARIHDILQHHDEIFLVMEYVQGKNLRERTTEPVPFDEFLNIATQCAEALVAAHQCGLVHRDLKPENIMITPKGRVKICDFGLARQTGSLDNATTVVERNRKPDFQGTPAYMAPEALLDRNPDFRADIFSLGVVFYELLTARHPFRQENGMVATIDRIIHSAHVPVVRVNPSVPLALSKIIDKMLRKQPTDRYSSPAELLSALRGLERTPPTEQRQSRRVVLAAIFVIVLLAGVLGLLRLNRDRPLVNPGQQRNLVVLPLRANGGTSESQYYSDGLTATLTARLSRSAHASALLVVPWTEVRSKRVTSPEEARKQFAADLVLAGTMSQTDSGLQVVYSLDEASPLRQLKSGTVTASTSNPTGLEDQIVDAVLSAVEGRHLPLEDLKHDTSIAAAYDSYIQGEGHLQDNGDSENLKTAMQSFQRAAKLDPGYATAYAALGEAYWAKYRATKEPVWVELARQACEQADQLNSRSSAAKVCLGTVNSGLGHFEASIKNFEVALDIEPANDAAYLGLADAQEGLRNYDGAELTLHRAIQLKPNYYLGYSRLGQFYLKRTRYKDAADQFQKEITLIPNNEQSYLSVGAAYIYLGRYEDAITVLQRSINLRATARGYSNLGSTYLRLRRFEQAIPVFEQAVNLFPRNSIFAGNLARAYYWAGRHDKATASYEHAISLASEELKLNPRNADAHLSVARYYAMLGRKVDALNHLTTALQLQPTEAEYLSYAAVIHNQLGDRASAIASLKKAIALGWSMAEINSEIEFDSLRNGNDYQNMVGTN